MTIINEVQKKFNHWEINNDVFNFRIEGITVWQYVRYELCFDIQRVINKQNCTLYYNKEFPKKNFYCRSKNIIKENPCFFLQKDILIINDFRRKKIGDIYRSSYMDGMLDDMKLSYIILESKKREDRGIKIDTDNLIFYDPYVFLTYGEIKEKDKKRIECLIHSLEETFGIDLAFQSKKIINSIGGIIASRKWFRHYYCWILNQIKPKILVIFGLQNTLENLFLIEIAREKHIKTVAIADGIGVIDSFITLRNGQNFMDKKGKELLESKYIKTSVEFLFLHLKVGQAMDVPRIIEIGNAYHNERVKLLKDCINNRDYKIILITSNWYANSKADIFAKYIADYLPKEKYKVLFKLHPADTDWRYKYPCLLDSKVKVVGINNDDIYDYFAMADYIVATHSTVLCEAISFQKPLFLIKSAGYEWTSYLHKLGLVQLINNGEEFIDIITNQQNEPRKVEYSDIWPEEPARLFNQNLEKIIKGAI